MTDQTQHILGQSPAFLDMMDHVSRLAPVERPALIVGERGTGKELIAERIHFLSSRWGQAFVKLNCAALPETLLESELFGHERGAFTGATERRIGRFELADGGTLFLDEIGTMSMAAQEKLLRVIEYGKFERIGGTETLEIDVRVIGATNIDLPEHAGRGKFRHDLLDRIAFDVVTLPPLRARRGDIGYLASTFASRLAIELGWPSFPGFSRRCQKMILDYEWPGNVRELKNTVERAVFQWLDTEKAIDHVVLDPFESPWRPHSDSKISDAVSVPGETAGKSPSENKRAVDVGDFRENVEKYEKALVEKALGEARFNQKEAAALLSLTYDQLRHQIRKHNITV